MRLPPGDDLQPTLNVIFSMLNHFLAPRRYSENSEMMPRARVTTGGACMTSIINCILIIVLGTAPSSPEYKKTDAEEKLYL